MERYERFEIGDIGWDGLFIMMLMEVAAEFRRGLDPRFLVKTAAV